METPDTYTFLFFGYSVIWAVFVLFLFRLGAEQKQLKRQIQELQASSKDSRANGA